MIRQTTSASNLFRRALCPASHWMEDGIPDEENDVAKMGTLGHLHFADKTIDRSSLDADLQRQLRVGDEEEIAFYCKVEQAENILGEEFETVYERELWFTSAYGAKLFPGHCDAWRWYPKSRVLAIPDLKLGYIPVTGAESNWQIAAYGCMGRQLTQCAVFYGGIIQPRLPRDSRLTMARYDAQSLDAAAVDIEKVYEDAQNAVTIAHEIPGELQCRNCKGKTRCKAFTDRVASLIPSLPRPLEKKQVPRVVAVIDDERFGQIGDNIKFAEMLKDGWKAEAIKRISEGRLTDWKLDPGSMRRTITDTMKAWNRIEFAFGDDGNEDWLQSAFMRACKLSASALEKPIAEMLQTTQVDAKKQIRAALAPVTAETQDAPSVVRK